ncbi:MAG TPA: heparan-alpha-glucosaminide N-acetyltransferase [Beijerinckiaceae bacterium]|jgi:uncharacterized membrane protein
MIPNVVPAQASGRWQALDVARGVAVAAMILYHLVWDLSATRLLPPELALSPGWRAFAWCIAASFLALSGISLVLAHGAGIRWPAFLRRLALVAAAAAAVTVATWFAFPDSYIFFGILHAIALFSVLALPGLAMPWWALGAAAALVFAVAALWTGDLFDAPPLAFLGLRTRPPVTNDYVPIFPWFGFVLVGLMLARLASPALAARIGGWRSRSAAARGLAFGGRHSLAIYLLHQPLLFGGAQLLAWTIAPDARQLEAAFVQDYVAQCRQAAGEQEACAASAACTRAEAERAGLWRLHLESRVGPAEQARLLEISRACYAKARP